MRSWSRSDQNGGVRNVNERAHAVPAAMSLDASGRVVTTVGRMVCYDEKSSKPRAKEFADAVPFRFTVSDQKWGLPPGTLQSRFLVRRASCKPLRRYAFPDLRKLWSTAESRRGIWIEGRGDAPIALL